MTRKSKLVLIGGKKPQLRFVPPVDGMSAYVRSTGSNATFRRGAWEVASGPIASPAAGATIDTQARSAIDQILRALRQHGLITS